MKDSKEYATKLRSFYRSSKRKYGKIKQVTYDEPLDAMVYGIISENMTQVGTQSALHRFEEHFIDLNDLRVSQVEEIIEALGTDSSQTRITASRLSRVLGGVFWQYNTVSLDVLKKMGKRPARMALEKIDGASRFVIDYCMLAALQGHAIPLTTRMVEHLRNAELVHPEADETEIEGFLARQISAENAYEFYALLRSESELRKSKAKKNVKSKTVVKKKTKLKKTTKKKTKKTAKKK